MPGNKRSNVLPIFRSAFQRPEDEVDANQGIRPVVFDILAPDLETSVLPEGLRMVLHVNPSSMTVNYGKIITRIQTKGGFVEQHWGDGPQSIDFNQSTGGFVRLYSGMSNITGGGIDTRGTRRETIAYDKYLDLLALFHNNGSVFDHSGQIAFQGMLKITFDGGVYFGWFKSFNVNDAAVKPFQFELTSQFTISHEVMRFRSAPWRTAPAATRSGPTDTSDLRASLEPVVRGDAPGELGAGTTTLRLPEV